MLGNVYHDILRAYQLVLDIYAGMDVFVEDIALLI
jgi:hypothetical protein